ncbi:DUF305 domain-containing protein [Patescibacteria group bacterium]|nr:DUF305 domain-containing protein [Patescibacteria group bacterium]
MRTTLLSALLGGLVGGGLVLIFATSTSTPATDPVTDQQTERPHTPGSGAAGSSGGRGPGMMGGERGAHRAAMQQMLVTSEREFIEKMIPHHQEAIDTAREVLARGGTTPEVRTLMEGIIEAQSREIVSMRQWHETWFGTPYRDTGEYTPMMRELAGLSGAELDHAFLEDMIPHHMGAIMMARSIQPHIEHGELAELTEAIVEIQSAEIVLMRELLNTM